VVTSDGTMAVVGVTCFSWIAVLVSWIVCCGRCGCVPMNCQFAELDCLQLGGRDKLVVVPILVNRSVDRRRMVLVAILLED
jgi:hypothetical protein